MSQSKASYGVNTPKDSARSRRVEHDDQPEEAGDQPVEPACRTREVGRGIDRREWREIPYSERILAFYEPCEWDECYPDGPPDVEEVATVVRSCHSPTVFHRSRHETENSQTDAVADPHSTGVSITTLTDLTEGECVVWDKQSTPRRVIETATGSDGTVRLRGPSGGEYTVEARPGSTQAYAIYPAIGLVSSLRVVTADETVEAV
jgi:hypothetical protein